MVFQEVPDDSEVWLMSGKTKHDEISIGFTKHMLRVGIMVRSSSLLSEKWEINVMHLARCLPDEVHDFVLSFSRNIGDNTPRTGGFPLRPPLVHHTIAQNVTHSSCPTPPLTVLTSPPFTSPPELYLARRHYHGSPTLPYHLSPCPQSHFHFST